MPPWSGRVATLGELHRSPGWVWIWCGRAMPYCGHRAPMALAPLVIRWGPDASSDMIRQRAVCTKCGHVGATLQHPGWWGNQIGFEPFPDDGAALKFSNSLCRLFEPCKGDRRGAEC